MDDKDKVYTIAGRQFRLEKLKIGQLKMFDALLKGLSLDPALPVAEAIAKILDTLLEEKLTVLMQIIFPGQGAEKIEWLAVDYDTIDEVVEDFIAKSQAEAAAEKLVFHFGVSRGEPDDIVAMYNYDLLVYNACEGDITKARTVEWEIPFLEVFRFLCIRDYQYRNLERK